MLVAALVVGAGACTGSTSRAPSRADAAGASAAGLSSPPTRGPAPSADAGSTGKADAGVEDVARATLDEIVEVLFLDPARAATAEECPARLPDDARIRCLFDVRYRGDARAASLAHELWVRHGVVAGVEVAHSMDGGYRGRIALEPAVPTGSDRKHLEWTVQAWRDFDAFFDALARRAADGAPRPSYRFRPLTLRFMRSPGRHTPSAYAHDWAVAYNLNGSLLVSADTTRETLFHEVFHDNDLAHGDWSTRALRSIYDGIVQRCGTKVGCLAPYAPSPLLVRGGTYYSFQPNNGDSVHEYAADLATRYYLEHRELLFGNGRRTTTFKCGPPENARAWELMVREFFGGIDLVPACR